MSLDKLLQTVKLNSKERHKLKGQVTLPNEQSVFSEAKVTETQKNMFYLRGYELLKVFTHTAM